MINTWKLHSFTNLPIRIFKNWGVITYLILAVALAGFESFNFSTTQYALGDLLGSLSFIGIPWATILSIAFCGIDFAGIARIFSPDGEQEQAREVWFLFGAWLLAATMNAILTWWGVSMALTEHTLRSTSILDRKLLMQAVPVFVAVMVWVTRILLIGSFSTAGRRFQARPNYAAANRGRGEYQPAPAASSYRAATSVQPAASRTSTPAPLVTSRPSPQPETARQPAVQRPEPEYISENRPTPTASLPALRPLAVAPRTGANPPDRRF